ncbi:2-polyprenyl-6-methoxyphenol hydroxylase-like FAD-dependent oxidoreductase [Streptosporangium album]|uniref:2-polyprenyl-6-methoxyphenol hydroxylase-like FAD-dependent oxidoreductase n=1 Tax=Streptosporangium album TaxID=47479 RepID=A0A7W7RY27_9ACTN|nr:flavin-dependent oxidoreductase [Streptosporangium album]MBB4940345.1 2-polyprenyl-6-methoxyphenol hydroxylase-like FAD-dependent oxidoreductase [Streptosporangium album]
MRVLIIGGGIGGLTTALSLHAAGIDCEVVESVVEPRPLGVGINLQPHAVRELTELGLGEALAEIGVPTSHLTYADRFGGAILSLPRGRFAGYDWPQYSIHRGELQMLLLEAARERLGTVRTGLSLEDFEQDGTGVTVSLRDVRTGEHLKETADVLVGADGIHSTVRARLHPDDGPLLWNGIRMWRGTMEGEPFLDGATLIVAGSNLSAKFVAYPISARLRARGRALINWVAEVTVAEPGPVPVADWSRPGRLEDVLPHFDGWRFPYLDIPALISGAERILEYPMVDKDPLPRWGDGRVTLLGDAAHPMYPVGSNGGSQAVLDARVLARELACAADPVAGLAAYEEERRTATTGLVLAHRELPMEETIAVVTERAPDGFDDIADVLTPEELANMAAAQRRTTDMDIKALNSRSSWNVAYKAQR